MHPYDKVEQLLKKVTDGTHKHCCLVVGAYDYRPDVMYQLYLEDGWMDDTYSHKPVDTLGEAVEFLEAFLRERVSRGILFKRF